MLHEANRIVGGYVCEGGGRPIGVVDANYFPSQGVPRGRDGDKEDVGTVLGVESLSGSPSSVLIRRNPFCTLRGNFAREVGGWRLRLVG